MRIDEARVILEYAADIPRKLRAIAQEKEEIEGELNCLRGIEYGGMPQGSGHSDTTANIAERSMEKGYSNRLKMLGTEEIVLRGDFDRIDEQIRRLNTVYTDILKGIYFCGHSFEEIAKKVKYSVPHTKRLKTEALMMLSEALDDMIQAEEILKRAYNARKYKEARSKHSPR